jgi:hypothetical protein
LGVEVHGHVLHPRNGCSRWLHTGQTPRRSTCFCR